MVFYNCVNSGGNPSLFVLGIDRDPSAINDFEKSKNEFKTLDYSRLRLLNEKFSNLSRIQLAPFLKARGVLFDLGYSTAQVTYINASSNELIYF